MACPQDPLESFSGLSLLPRTFPNPPLSRDSDNPNSVHNLLLSLPVRNPQMLVDEAKNILDNTREIPNIGMAGEDTLKDKGEVAGDMAVPYPRGQRPGLQRKRARFSLLPTISQPSVNLEQTLDFDKGPEAFFLAYERHQNALKEMARQTGSTFTSSDQYNVFKVPRSERPGLPGRSRKATYKHLYPDPLAQNTLEGDVLLNGGLQKETAKPDLTSLETELDNVQSPQLESTHVSSEQANSDTFVTEELEITGSIANAEKTVDELIGELLAEEHLQIKQLHVEKLNLPEMEDVPKLDFKLSEVQLPSSRTVLSDINNFLAGIKGATPVKLSSNESFIPNFGSPTPPKSPLALLSMLNKRIFRSNSSRDPFSSTCGGQSPSIDASPVQNINKCSDIVDLGKSPTTKEDEVPVDGRSSTEKKIEYSTCSVEKHTNGISSSLGSGSEINTRESGSELEGNGVGSGNEFINENLERQDANVDHCKNGLDDLEDTVEDVMTDAEASAEPKENTDYFPVDTSKSKQNDCAVENQSSDDGHAEYVDTAPIQTQDMAVEQTQASPSELQTERMTESSEQSMNEIPKEKSRRRREWKNKNLSSRQSLAGCGLSWKAGVRRSTRIRSRPLEYWRGERFLYGRIHNGLATVIGIKYESPGKGTMKVKSFVSDEHRHLVDQAAL